MNGIDVVYQECGFYERTPTGAPLFSAVRDFVLRQRMSGRMSLWRASTLRVLESLCFRHGLGPVVNSTRSEDVTELFLWPTIIELGTLADSDKVFLTEALVLWLYELRKQQGPTAGLRHVLVLEEAHHVLSEFKERAVGAETIMETCLRQIREFGQGVVVIDQEPSKLSRSVKANAGCKISFALGTAADHAEMTGAMGFPEDMRDCFHLLRTGQAIVSVQHRGVLPIHVAFPEFRIPPAKPERLKNITT